LYSGSVIYTEKWGKKGAENGSKLCLQGLTRTYQIFRLMFSQLSTSSPPQRFHLTYLATGRPPKNYSKLVINITNFHKQCMKLAENPLYKCPYSRLPAAGLQEPPEGEESTRLAHPDSMSKMVHVGSAAKLTSNDAPRCRATAGNAVQRSPKRAAHRS
jgi:hypothetical protein